MVSLTSFRNVGQHMSLVGFLGSAIALITSTTIYDNSKIASLSTLSGTLSLLACIRIERSHDRDRLKQELQAKTDTLLRLEHELRDVDYQRNQLSTQLKPYLTYDGIPVDIHALNANNESLQCELSKVEQRLSDASFQLAAARDERESLRQESDRLRKEVAIAEGNKVYWKQTFDRVLTDHETEVETLTAKVNELNLENIHFKAQFENVNEVAKLRANHELYEIQSKLRDLNDQYFQTATLYNSAVADLKKLNADYVDEFTELNEAVSKGIPNAFQSVLDARDQELMRLSGHLSVLLQPQYFEAIGEYERANRLIKTLWESEQCICLDASEIVPYGDQTGFDVYFNLRDRKSRGQAFIESLNDRGNEFSIVCGCIKDLKFEYDRINPHRIKTAMVFRKAQKAESKATIDKLWIPAAQFEKVYHLLKKPVSRIMGSTGEGKGIFANLLLAIEANQLAPTFTRLHDPMDGSSEDYWQISKTSKGATATKNAIKRFVSEFKHRLENGISEPNTLDVFDEIDIIADSDSSINKDFLSCSKGMRHNGMRAYLIGQSPSVGKKFWEWADMDNFNCIYFGTAIITAIDKTPALKSQASALKKSYDKLREFCDKQNEDMDLEGGNQYRLGLLVTSGKATFFELPSADSILCDWSKLTEESAAIQSPFEGQRTSESPPVECPECGSANVRNKGKTKDGNSNYMKCKNCEHNFKVNL